MSLRYDRLAIDLLIMLSLCGGAVWADDFFHSAAPAAGAGYIAGVTALYRFKWIYGLHG